MFEKDLINNLYLGFLVQEEMTDFFKKNDYLQLTDFFKDIKINLEDINFKKINKPYLYKYQYAKDIKKNQNDIFKCLFSKDFDKLINELLNLNLKRIDSKFTKYERGDFILINEKNNHKEDIYEVIIDFTEEEFDCENFGGKITYTDKSKELFYLNPNFNTLTIFKRKKGINKFLKYINSQSKDNCIYRFEINYKVIINK